ncbi:MAG: hypothetical protein AAF458_09765 [Pseudomonadota bacterium]
MIEMISKGGPLMWLLLACVLAVVTATGRVSSAEQPAKGSVKLAEQIDLGLIDIDDFIATHVEHGKRKNRVIKRPSALKFDARVKQHARRTKKPNSYLNSILGVFRFSPLPSVNHQMYLETANGKIFPVYIEDGQVDALAKAVKEDGRSARFSGYHVYTYSKGPAILVTDFDCCE